MTVAFGLPKPLKEDADRKVLTKQAENDVRRMLVALNRGDGAKDLPIAAE